ncbi:Utp21 specific WD40 associated putative domain-containing protein [Syncephalis pseudoplumigaleata]|uniref:Utp21 specific WD40 associated putative domain-containing protein n=1 Tax=Syncephalis pseudoplumigaleata TaxID=1712513 RepID=A0A4P9Z5G7_9FUNG|nr:Utp21 specific WD40 associated putative domain-containing protein [Syncephalis pseudoplumigaleata]|eukprot:RKP27041.1 Utp21 specific WD40 associated putative domain-containing protein [Syncephalis pseudoplumigaleata]
MVSKTKKARAVQNKKARKAVQSATVEHTSLFQPFRAIGYVTRDVPFSLQARGQAYFLTTCLDHSFQIYNCDKLNAVLVGPTIDRPIHCVAAQGDLTFVGCDSSILVYERVSQVVKELTIAGKADVQQLLPFGDLLVAIYSDNVLRTWRVSEQQIMLELPFHRDQFAISAVIHPSTYLNKLLLASEQGGMELWNIATGKCVYKFKPFPARITCLAQSPVVDVVAVGMEDGTVLLHNARLDEPVMSVKQEGRVTSITFRTDEHQMMAVGNATGDITLWDLEHRRLIHTMADAHDGRVHAQFLNGQPILVSTGINAIKQWIFDGPDDAMPRLLRSRGGHSLPPTLIRSYDMEGNYVVSASKDRSLRILSTRRDRQCAELSQGSVAKNAQRLGTRADALKLGPVIAFDTCELKQHHWDNIVTAHLNSPEAHSWSFQRRAIGQHQFRTRDGSAVKSVALSACGNFALFGLASGSIEMYNVQSGIFRRALSGKDGHNKPVTGVASDATNHFIYSTSLDQTVKIWSFNTGELQATVSIGSPVTGACLNRENDLLVVASDDLCLRVVDTQTHRVVREFHGHTNRITDFIFSPDGRWIVSASLDGTVRTWDLSTGHLIDWFATEQVCVSLTFTPDNAMLATAHVDQLGVFLWANRAHYMNIPLRRIPTAEPCRLQLPSVSNTSEAFIMAESDSTIGYTTPEQLVTDMITLSSVPQSIWQRLLHLDTIKKRNKPKQPVKAPKSAPFFLQTELDEAGPRFVPTQQSSSSAAADEGATNVLKLNELQPTTELGQLLRAAEASASYTAAMAHLQGLNPSGVDFAIRSLSPMDDCKELALFLAAIYEQMQSKRNFDALEAYLNVFLKIHSDLVLASAALSAQLHKIRALRETEWSRVEDLFQTALCLVDFGRNVFA